MSDESRGIAHAPRLTVVADGVETAAMRALGRLARWVR